MDIEIKPFDPDNPNAGIITSQRSGPGRNDQVKDDMMRKAADPSDPIPASEATMDDSPELLLDE